MSKQREEFEAWAKREDYNISRVDDRPHLYNWASTQCCWDAWQASRAAALEEAAMEADSTSGGLVYADSIANSIRALKEQS